MGKQKKFTFKTEKPTGRWRSFYHPMHYIKLDKKEVGMIDDSLPHSIRLQVIKDDIMEDHNPNCVWKWITLKKRSDSLQEAKDFLNENIEDILGKYKIHLRQ